MFFRSRGRIIFGGFSRKQNGSMNLKTFFFFSTIRSYLFDFFGYVLRESATPAVLSFSPSSELNDNGLRRLMYSFVLLFIISLAEL